MLLKPADIEQKYSCVVKRGIKCKKLGTQHVKSDNYCINITDLAVNSQNTIPSQTFQPPTQNVDTYRVQVYTTNLNHV